MTEPLKEVRDGYVIALNLGTPPQIIQVYLDTGSDLTWVPCGNLSFDCLDCNDYRNNKFTTMSGCSLTTLVRSTCSRPCPSFAYTYGDGIVAETLSRDILRVHASNPNSTREITRRPSHNPQRLPTIHSNVESPMYPNFYYIGLEAITVGNTTPTQVPLNLRGFDSAGNEGMIIDSGTTYTHLPEPFYSQLVETLEAAITYPRATQVEERSGFSLCYHVPCQFNNILGADDIPPITFHFLKNASLTLPQGNSFYAMGAPSNSTVVKCLLFQSMDGENEIDHHYGPAGVFGSFQQQNVEVVYDLNKERIGFQVSDCAVAAVSS
ncbi:hypothetical protein SASPL_113971 [Salvia splendens]|uniref:Peptidase A1 domain-containing protein n=1 Tax=Salvia splendens TaxID=180675 RepID=A0A8X8XZU6_SALSN|nr:hypothetical protein SASPL_113971 [Salvia splendens]